MTTSSTKYEKGPLSNPAECATNPHSPTLQQVKGVSLTCTSKTASFLASLQRFSYSSGALGVGSLKSCNSDRIAVAQAVTLYDWNGVIPRCRVQGLPIKQGMSVDICKVVSSHWCQAHHDGLCMVVPRAFLNILRVYDESNQALFPVLEPLPVERNPTPPRFGRLSSLSCFSSSSLSETNDKSRPPIPPPPFGKEAHEAAKGGSRLAITIECQSLQSLGVVITFKLALTPAQGLRYTGLTLNAILPAGYQIAGISPENHQGSSTAVRERHSHTETKHGLLLRGGSPLSGPAVNSSEKVVLNQEVAYTRVTNSSIRGGGINTPRATWVAEEDIGGQSGLEEHMDLKMLLQTRSCPPKIKYMYTLEIEGGGAAQQVVAADQTWKSPWIEEYLP